MLKTMILIVFAITVWEYRKEVSNSILSISLIILSYSSNLIQAAKTRIRIRKAKVKRKSSEDEEKKVV